MAVQVTHVTRALATADGGSQFEELDISLDKQSWFGVLSRSMAVHELLFCDVEGSCDMDWHTAPCRQFVIIIDGAIDVTTTDGVTKRFSPGKVLLVEDTTGKGHKSKVVDNKPAKSIMIKLREGFQV